MKYLKKKIGRNPQAAWQEIEDKIVIVTPRTKKIHIVSGCGSRIWQLIEKPRLGASVMDMLADEFSAERKRLEKDLEDFIEEMVSKDAVELKDE